MKKAYSIVFIPIFLATPELVFRNKNKPCSMDSINKENSTPEIKESIISFN